MRNAIARSIDRFEQLEARTSARLRLAVDAEGHTPWGKPRTVRGTPRTVSGGLARELFHDAVEHATSERLRSALAALGAWTAAPAYDLCSGGCQRVAIEGAMEIGADDYSDTRAVQLIACPACARRRIAVYEESRRGADTRSHHFANDGRHVTELADALQQCATPREPRCRCAAHERARALVDARWMTGPCEPVPVPG